MNTNINDVMKLVAVMALIALMPACNVDMSDQLSSERSRPEQVSKAVDLKFFKKIEGQAFNFDATFPDLLAVSGDILYVAESAGKNLWSWDFGAGNIQTAWKQATGFKAAAGLAVFDLNNGNRTITKLAPLASGVAVAISNDSTPPILGNLARAGGVAIFRGMSTEPEASTGLFKSFPWQPADHLDLVSIDAKSGGQALYLISSAPGGGANYVSWLNLSNPEVHSRGYSGLPNYNVPELKFSDGASTALSQYDLKIQAASPLPDGRLALASIDGLLTIKKDSVGVKNADIPRLDQKTPHVPFQNDPTSTLDANHATQFQTDGKAPTRVGAMRLVGDKYLLISFIDDGSKNGGLKFADVTTTPMVFNTNLSVPESKVSDIVVSGNEARLVSPDQIYAFSEGRFSLEFNGPTLDNDKANTSSGFSPDGKAEEATYSTFKGGNVGKVPANGTKFHAVAKIAGDWVYATSNGLFVVKVTTETWVFNKKTGQKI